MRSSTTRRGALVALAVAGGLGMTACGADGAADTAGGGPAPVAAAAGRAGGSRVPRCATADLAVTRGGEDHASGSRVLTELVFRNTGRAACALRGHPGVSLVDAAGVRLGSAALRSGDSSSAGAVLIPHAHAFAPLQTTREGVLSGDACRERPAASLRIFPPEQTQSVILPFPERVCTAPGTLRVGAVFAEAA